MSPVGHDFTFCALQFCSVPAIHFFQCHSAEKGQERFPYGSQGSDRFVLLLNILLLFELLKGGFTCNRIRLAAVFQSWCGEDDPSSLIVFKNTSLFSHCF